MEKRVTCPHCNGEGYVWLNLDTFKFLPDDEFYGNVEDAEDWDYVPCPICHGDKKLSVHYLHSGE